MKKGLFLLIFTVAVSLIINSAYADKQAKPSDMRQFRPREIKMDRNHDGKVDRLEY